jgi:hypothetical protein
VAARFQFLEGEGGVSAAPPVHQVPGMAPGLRPFREEEGPASAPEAGSGCQVTTRFAYRLPRGHRCFARRPLGR